MSRNGVSEEALAAGMLISDRFRLRRMLGSGGMGSVWEASHLALGTEIAIKFLDPRLSSRDDIRSRFAQEATAAARIKSRHVVSILDYGFTEDGRGFIAMELLQGEDLGRRLERLAFLPPEEVAPIVSQTCRGLGKAHALGTIHRDIKPENLFLVDEEDGVLVKVLDFGIAKSLEGNATSPKTDTGQLLGTPLYMSPEQTLGRVLDTRTDLYSLAVVAYRCLAGRPPFLSSATGELIVAVSTLEPPPPSRFNPSLSPALDRWFEQMLRKDPDARLCQTAQELADSFRHVCAGLSGGVSAAVPLAAVPLAVMPLGVDAPTLPAEPAPAEGEPPSSMSAGPGAIAASTPPVESRRGSRRTAQLLPLFVGAAVLALATTYGWRRQRGTQPEGPPMTPSVSSAPARAAKDGTIEVHFAARPAEAILYLDGQPLTGNPHSSLQVADTRPHRLRAEAPGYSNAEREVSLERDLTAEIVLSPESATASGSTAPAGSAPAAPASKPPAPRRARSQPAAPSPPPARAPSPAATEPKPPKSELLLDRSNPWKAQ